jgi:hypothetical protein
MTYFNRLSRCLLSETSFAASFVPLHFHSRTSTLAPGAVFPETFGIYSFLISSIHVNLTTVLPVSNPVFGTILATGFVFSESFTGSWKTDICDVCPILGQWARKLHSFNKFSTHHKNRVIILITVKCGFANGFFKIIFGTKTHGQCSKSIWSRNNSHS